METPDNSTSANNEVDGRKTRGPKGPRTKFFVCAMIGKDGEIVHQEVEANSADEAKDAFKAANKKNPASILGAFYKVKNGTAQENSGPIVNLEDIAFSGQTFEAIYEGFQIRARGIKAIDSYKDNELVLVTSVGDRITEGARKPRATQKILVASELDGFKAVKKASSSASAS